MLRVLQRHSDPARCEVDEIKKVLRCLKSSGARIRFSVGAGVYLANTNFMREFGGIQSFRLASAREREQFFARLSDLELSLRSRGLGMSMGVGLYRIWLADVLADRRHAADLLGEQLTELSRKGMPDGAE
jgi:hypothetical protein